MVEAGIWVARRNAKLVVVVVVVCDVSAACGLGELVAGWVFDCDNSIYNTGGLFFVRDLWLGWCIVMGPSARFDGFVDAL